MRGLSFLYYSDGDIFKEKLANVKAKLRTINPNYVADKESQENVQAGCYVATAVYGSYDCPQVWTLRRFRDNTLTGSWYGRAFIRVYYTISPTLVKWFGKTEWFKNFGSQLLTVWSKSLTEWVQKIRHTMTENGKHLLQNYFSPNQLLPTRKHTPEASISTLR